MSGPVRGGGEDPELARVRDRYARREAKVIDRFGEHAERERMPILLERIDRLGMPRERIRLLEIGCGDGRNLLGLVAAGFDPGRLVGNELLPARAAAARAHLPRELTILEGDACGIALDEASMDVVFQSTVFTSILDQAFRERLAARLWRLVRPGGAFLWYDFTLDNPRNPDVRGVPIREIRQLFPEARADFRRVTLLPPLGRAALRLPGAVGTSLYRLLAAIPPCRSHVIGWLEKPAGNG